MPRYEFSRNFCVHRMRELLSYAPRLIPRHFPLPLPPILAERVPLNENVNEHDVHSRGYTNSGPLRPSFPELRIIIARTRSFTARSSGESLRDFPGDQCRSARWSCHRNERVLSFVAPQAPSQSSAFAFHRGSRRSRSRDLTSRLDIARESVATRITARSQRGQGVIVDTPTLPRLSPSFRLESSLIVPRIPVCPRAHSACLPPRHCPFPPTHPPPLFRRGHMVFREMNEVVEGRTEFFRYSTPPAPEISSAPRRGEMPYVINQHSTSAFDPVTPGASARCTVRSARGFEPRDFIIRLTPSARAQFAIRLLAARSRYRRRARYRVYNPGGNAMRDEERAKDEITRENCAGRGCGEGGREDPCAGICASFVYR